MPNHTENTLVVTGPTVDVNKFISKVDPYPLDGDSSHLQFGLGYPMPEELINTSFPVDINTQEEIDAQWAEYNNLGADHWMKKFGKPFKLGITQETNDKLIAKYGVNNWYHWCVRNWGTKWDAYDTSAWTTYKFDNDTLHGEIRYHTAWAPATEFLLNISREFNTLTFTHTFADEDQSFLGREVINDGKIIDAIDTKWNSKAGEGLREFLGIEEYIDG